MIAWLIVAGSLLFGAALLIAWLLRPGVRVWLEAPKYRFQNNVRRYDRTGPGPASEGGPSR
jgi:hypothetical protein